MGSLQPAAVRSTNQISRSRAAFPGTGRFEIKNNRAPSAVINGSASEYCPENGAISGLDQRPRSNRETMIVQKLNVGVLRTKYSVLPSGVNAGCESYSPVEIMPSPKMVGAVRAFTLAYGCVGPVCGATAWLANITMKSTKQLTTRRCSVISI